MQLEFEDVHSSFDRLFETFNNVLLLYNLIENMSNKDKEGLGKLRVAQGIITSINIKNNISKKYNRQKEFTKKKRIV